MRNILSLAAAAAFVGLGASALPAQAQTAPATAPLRVAADVVTGARNGKGAQGVICVQQSVFFPGDWVIFRALVSDANGTPLTAEQIAQRGVKVSVKTGEGTTMPLQYGVHPPPDVPVPQHDNYFAAAYHIAADHPTGNLPWTLTVTDAQNHTLTFNPIGQAAGIAILQIAAKAPAAPK
jgi:hypothetical protein